MERCKENQITPSIANRNRNEEYINAHNFISKKNLFISNKKDVFKIIEKDDENPEKLEITEKKKQKKPELFKKTKGKTSERSPYSIINKERI